VGKAACGVVEVEEVVEVGEEAEAPFVGTGVGVERGRDGPNRGGRRKLNGCGALEEGEAGLEERGVRESQGHGVERREGRLEREQRREFIDEETMREEKRTYSREEEKKRRREEEKKRSREEPRTNVSSSL